MQLNIVGIKDAKKSTVPVVAVDAGYTAGRGAGARTLTQADIEAFGRAICTVSGHGGPRTYRNIESLAAAACRAANSDTSWWVKLDTGYVLFGYSDGSHIAMRYPR